ncbi:exodeoxyribonuclease VII large subunit [Carnobacterium gallinarum]|uniref:exodeoxyribonuclease VII large subunit n=1 Tax=Carnobacterium gallinarum TaxID=2749 RepID=UPI000557A8DF|nr:exodeoxyribonuclease VII large subunit [Carnobacterium gallinarum]
MSSEYLTVTALTKYLKRKFDVDPYLERVYLTGEISNFRMRPNAHQYFSLKDNQAKISALMFKGAFQKLKFTPEEGMKVLVIGRISLYEASGNYQIYVEHMEPDGVGALYQALEEMKKKLQQEGLFNAPKQLISTFPKRIAVITSPSGAVVRDIMTTVKRRYPIVQLVIFPTLVQGDRAADDIVRSIHLVEEQGNFDTMIIARGGGSIEDLWPFNEEKVARAIFEATTPSISSVGHETDITIADLVADVRAATPTAAAELSVPLLSDELLKIEQLRMRLLQSYTSKLNVLNQRLNHSLSSYIFRQPERLYEGYAQNLDLVSQRLMRSLTQRISDQSNYLDVLNAKLKANNPQQMVKQKRTDIETLTMQLTNQMERYMSDKTKAIDTMMQSLDYLSPLKIMDRGYSYVTKENEVIKAAKQVELDDTLHIHLGTGHLEAKVIKKVEES